MKGASYCYHLFLMPSIAFDVLLFLRRAEIYQVVIVFSLVLKFYYIEDLHKEIIGFVDQLRASIH